MFALTHWRPRESGEVTAAASEAAPRASRGWRTDLPGQCAVIAAGGAAYALNYAVLARLFSPARRDHLAAVNAAAVVRLERALRIFNEGAVQRFALTHGWAGRLFDLSYMWLHLPLIVVLAIWLYARHRLVFVATRDAMLISGLIALACEYWPVAPPYLVAHPGIVNTAASCAYNIVEPKGFFDSYGAVPSIHVAWALLVTIAVWQASRARWLRWPALAVPLLMTLAVVATGNHYWFDAATGVLAALVGLAPRALLARRQSRGRSP